MVWGEEKGSVRVAVVDRSLFDHAFEAPFEVGTRAKDLACACEHHDFDALVDVKHRVDRLEVGYHLYGECIVFVGTIQRDDHDGGCFGGARGVMGYFGVGEGEGLVGLWRLDRGWLWDHFRCAIVS